VRVNGRVPPESGLLVEDADHVTLNGQPVAPLVRFHHLALNKPAGIVVTARDPESRTTVFDLVKDSGAPRLFAVGRLDVATTGLLVLTDDGELANRLAHPRHKVPKEYLAIVAGIPGERDLRALREGVELDDGRTQPAEVELIGASRGVARVRLIIREGRNRQVRRMLEAVGHPVRQLERTGFGPVRLGRLRQGSWRKLRPEELEALREAASAPARGDASQ
jgi:23S rRNA pseudouridine2605 synthase